MGFRAWSTILKLYLLLAAAHTLNTSLATSVNTTQPSNGLEQNNQVELSADQIDAQLAGKCFNNIFLAEWWSYVWCHRSGVRQVHYNHQSQRVEIEHNLGNYIAEESEAHHQIFRSSVPDCTDEKTGEVRLRYSEVSLECCEETGRQVVHMEAADQAGGTVVAIVTEPLPCSYYIVVCSRAACREETVDSVLQRKESERISLESESQKKTLRELHLQRQRQAHDEHQRALKTGKIMHSGSNAPVEAETDMQGETTAISDVSDTENLIKLGQSMDAGVLEDWQSSSHYHTSLEHDIPTEQDQNILRDRVRHMFHRAYDAYMEFGFPDAELKPLTCIGGTFDLVKIPLVTLIDTLDTLVIMGNHTEFRRAVGLVQMHYNESKFDIDVNVSVFEVTIRVLGGLLSAHQMAVDAQLGIYNDTTSERYDGGLLKLAIDLGDRLLPAFKTNTGIPYGTVNLRSGVPTGETEIASTAGAGTLIVEFEVLSSLSQNRQYGDVAYAALTGLFNRRSSIGLLGKHIHIDTGAWFESVSGIGSNSDSFYEYLLKAYLLFRHKDMFTMFTTTYSAIKRFVQSGDWFRDVDMFNGKLRRHRTENLHAFWPGMEATLGFSESGARSLNAFYSVWYDLGFLPEELDDSQWLQGKVSINGYYPLRPELIESTYLQYRTTMDRSWLVAGEVFLDSLEQKTSVANNCGYASISNVETGTLKDEMPSFFLSETLKYLYLLFDETNFVHSRDYIFSTEAHPFDPNQLVAVPRGPTGPHDTAASSSSDPDPHKSPDEPFTVLTELKELQDHLYSDDGDLLEASDETETSVLHQHQPSLPFKCAKKYWWDVIDGYVLNSISPAPPSTAPDGTVLTNPQKGVNRLTAMVNSHTKKYQQHQRLKRSRSSAALDSHASSPSAGTNTPQSSIDQAVAAETQAKAPRPVAEPLTSKSSDGNENTWGAAFLASLAKGINTLISPFPKDAMLLEHKQTEAKANGDGAKSDPSDAGHAGWNSEYSKIAESHVRKYRRMTRISNSLYNIARITTQLKARGQQNSVPDAEALLRQNQQQVRRANTCYAEDEPVMKGHQNAVQTVDVSMGALGEFTVHVYSDGFVVHSKKFGNTLEISNIGQPIMFVRDFNKTSSKTVLGDIAGDVISCSVSLVPNDMPLGSQEEESPGSEGAKKKSLPAWERSCTVASFGPTNVAHPITSSVQAKHYKATPDAANVADSGAEPVTGIKDLETLCNDEVSQIRANKHTPDAGVTGWWGGLWGAPDAPAPAGEAEAAFAAKAMFNAPIKLNIATERAAEEAPQHVLEKRDDSLSGRIAIARRGDCMFEEKAERAHSGGAQALIVVNDEDGLFVMSGKAVVATPSTSAADERTPTPGTTTSDAAIAYPKSKYGDMPTVMLIGKDGTELVDLLAAHAAENNGVEAQVQIRVSSTPMFLNSPWMGDFSTPQVRMKRNVIHVVSRENWGAILSSATGQEWQLFIMSKSDMSAAPVWPTTVLTESNEQITTTAALSLNPLELYKRTLSRTCPSFIQHCRHFGVIETEAATQTADPRPSTNDAAIIAALKVAPVTLKLQKKDLY